jgi:AraC-like DNA-binding protein
MIFHQPHNSKTNYNYNAFFYQKEKWDPHFHKNFELVYVLQGEIECVVGNMKQPVKHGEFALALSNEVHSIIPQENALYWVGVFSEDYVRAFSKAVQGKTGDSFVFNCSESVNRFLLDNLITDKTPPVYMLKACLYAVCEEYSNSVNLTDKNMKDTEAMLKITDYVLKNHKNDISLSSLASLLGYDYHYVSRYFHEVFNMSFADYLNSYRLETAIAMLEETDKTIADIAFESGFQSVRSFNNCFKTRFGTPPSAYRKTIK